MAEQPSTEVLVERISNLQADVSEIKANMATRSDQNHTDERIAALSAVLAQERAERMAAIEVEKKERVEGDNSIRARLQLVEDRLESRKYGVGIAIALSVIGAVVGVLFR